MHVPHYGDLYDFVGELELMGGWFFFHYLVILTVSVGGWVFCSLPHHPLFENLCPLCLCSGLWVGSKVTHLQPCMQSRTSFAAPEGCPEVVL